MHAWKKLLIYARNARNRCSMHVWKKLLIYALSVKLCHGDMMSIGDNMYPYVSLLDPAV